MQAVDSAVEAGEPQAGGHRHHGRLPEEEGKGLRQFMVYGLIGEEYLHLRYQENGHGENFGAGTC